MDGPLFVGRYRAPAASHSSNVVDSMRALSPGSVQSVPGEQVDAQIYQLGGRFSMKAWAPSSAQGSIMLQAIVAPASSYAASMPTSIWR